MTSLFAFPLVNYPLIPVKDLQKNATKQFEKGLVRITKNGKSLGYVISDEMMEEILENIEALNPKFIAEMKKEDEDKNLTSFENLKKKYSLN